MTASFKVLSLFRWRQPRPILYFLLTVLVLDIAFVHLSEIRDVEPAQYYAFKAEEPFLSPILLPLLFKPFAMNFTTCSTGLNFPLQACADILSMMIDSVSLLCSCLVVLATFRRLNAIVLRQGSGLHLPELCVPMFLWMVCFCYVLVPNRALYYPYDFPEWLFFAAAVRIAVASNTCGIWLIPLSFLDSLNKETAIFLPILFYIYTRFFAKPTRTRLIYIVLAVAAVPLGKYLCLSVIYGQLAVAPRQAVDIYIYHVLDNVKPLANPLAWLAWGSALGGGFIALLLPSRTMARIKREVLCVALAWTAIMFLVGIAREIRLWGPMIFPMMLPLTFIVDDLLYSDRRPPP